MDMSALTTGVLSLGITAIVIALVVAILAGFMSALTNAEAIDVVNQSIIAIATLPTWFKIIILAIVAAVVLGLIAVVYIVAQRLRGE